MKVVADAPCLQKLRTGDEWLYCADWKARVEEEGEGALTIEIAAGFVTDLASVPKRLRGRFDNGSGDFGVLVASQMHDALYATHYTSKDFADNLFRKALRALGMGRAKARCYWLAVHLFGGKAWARAENDPTELEHARGFVKIKTC